MSVSIHSIYELVFKIWRAKRAQVFLKKISPLPSEKMLDVGGVPTYWTSRPQPVKSIKCINIYDLHWEASMHPEHRIEIARGDGCCLTEAPGEFEIVFSNSVIEHVGNFAKQQQFASEIRRVGTKLWVQTPAFECPLEPHFMMPFVHWLPTKPREFVIRWFSPWSYLEKPSTEKIKTTVAFTQLLTKRQMQTLFPDCEILTERMLGFIPKSYIAIRTPACQPAEAAVSASASRSEGSLTQQASLVTQNEAIQA